MTNQMISACKAYITNNGTASIWSQPQDVVVEKILSAIKLKQVMIITYLDNVFIYLCFLFTDTPVACGSSQPRVRIGAAA